MNPGFLLVLLVACLLALLPVWRLRIAGWPPRALGTAWLVYVMLIVVAVRFVGLGAILLPIIVVAYIAPFVAGPERLTRVLNGRRRDGRPIIDVTPKPAPGLRGPGDPPRDDEPKGDGR